MKKENRLKTKNIIKIIFIIFMVIFVNNHKITNELLGIFNIQIDNKILQELLRSNDNSSKKSNSNNITTSLSNDIIPNYSILDFNVIEKNIIYIIICMLLIIAYFLVGIIKSIYNRSRKRLAMIYV